MMKLVYNRQTDPWAGKKLVQALHFEPTVWTYTMCICWICPGRRAKADILRGSRAGQWLNDREERKPPSQAVEQTAFISCWNEARVLHNSGVTATVPPTPDSPNPQRLTFWKTRRPWSCSRN